MKDKEKDRERLIGELAEARREVARLERMMGVAPPAAGGEPAEGEGSPGGRAPDGDGIAILVVDDDEPFRRFVAKTLARFGYRVLEAAGAEEALAAIEEFAEPVGLVLADIMLPGSSGRDLVRSIQGRLPGIEALYMSGYAEGAVVPDDVFNVMERGGRLLQKPFTTDTLLAEVRCKLERN